MNGESVFGWIKAIATLAVFAVLAFVLYKVYALIKSKGVLPAAVDAGNYLKKETPLGAPARGIDAVISWFTGREETLGGLAAEVFDPATRQANRIAGGVVKGKPSGDPSVLMGGTNSVYLGDLPIGDIALPNPRDAR